MSCSIIGIYTNRPFLQVECGKAPDIFFQFGVQVRCQQIFKDGRTERTVFYFCIQDAGLELSSIYFQQLAKKRSVDGFNL